MVQLAVRFKTLLLASLFITACSPTPNQLLGSEWRYMFPANENQDFSETSWINQQSVGATAARLAAYLGLPESV